MTAANASPRRWIPALANFLIFGYETRGSLSCARAQLSPDLLRQAARQAPRRGLVVLGQLPEVEKALAPFGGIM